MTAQAVRKTALSKRHNALEMVTKSLMAGAHPDKNYGHENQQQGNSDNAAFADFDKIAPEHLCMLQLLCVDFNRRVMVHGVLLKNKRLFLIYFLGAVFNVFF